MLKLKGVASATIAVLVAGCVIDELREDDVGDARACEGAARWPHEYADLEDDLLELIQRARGRGTTCGDTVMNPVPDVAVAPTLRCAARLHATFLAQENDLSHEGAGDTTPTARVAITGYEGAVKHEVLARDFESAADVLEAWQGSPAHCVAIHDLKITDIGIGHSATFRGDATAWVVLTGEPRTTDF